MKKLVIPALLLGAMSATGCIFVSDDSGDDVIVDGTATIDVSWELLSDDVAAACPAGATTAAIHAQAASDNEVFTDLYNCADGGGITTDLALDTYTVWVELTDDSGATLYAQSEPVDITLDLDGEVAAANFRIQVDHGFFDLSWEIQGSDCATENASGVSLVSTVADNTSVFYDDIFTCAEGEAPNIATTYPLPIGDYVLDLTLLDQNDVVIGEGPQSPNPTATIAYGNEFVDLGIIPITLLP